ncbi:hypothetical protein Bca52824_022563 [Brassica carinata]|uniref:Bet v I/Major latex protein domain-containing protein n=1 Tax=Brassica carinata TaxID=52824 RepID=A0A8X7VGS5_BRACI|nr:hypothetical protein Bca52824_022563 [Brassica carinata]
MTRSGKEKDVEQPEIVSKVLSDPYGSVHDSISQDISTVRLTGDWAGSDKEVHWANGPDFKSGRLNLDLVRMDELVSRFIIVLGTKPSIVESNRSVFGVINAYLVMVSGTKDGGANEKITEYVGWEKRTETLSMSRNLVTDSYKKFKATMTVTPKAYEADGSCVLWTVEFEKIRHDVEDPVWIIDSLINYLKVIDGILIYSLLEMTWNLNM